MWGHHWCVWFTLEAVHQSKMQPKIMWAVSPVLFNLMTNTTAYSRVLSWSCYGKSAVCKALLFLKNNSIFVLDYNLRGGEYSQSHCRIFKLCPLCPCIVYIKSPVFFPIMLSFANGAYYFVILYAQLKDTFCCGLFISQALVSLTTEQSQ